MFPGDVLGLKESQRQRQRLQQQNQHYQQPGVNPENVYYPNNPANASTPLPPFDTISTAGYWRPEQNPQNNSRSANDQMINPNQVLFDAPNAEYLQQAQNFTSNLTGRKKALLVGINYYGTSSQLNGCVADVNYVKSFICSTYGFVDSPESMLCLTDDHNNPAFLPTKNNIIEAMHWLVRGAQPGDSLFFQFSGHGTYVKDLDGDEDDGYDEAICPLDFNQAGPIIDDDINAILVRSLTPNVRLTAISDSCHSGSVMDLPYTYYSDGRLKVASKSKEAASVALGSLSKFVQGDNIGGLFKLVGGVKNIMNLKTRDPNYMAQFKGNVFSDVLLISGCKDSQTSSDTVIAGRNTGALTHAFVEVLKNNRNPTLRELLINIRNILYRDYTQKPQLSTGRLIDMNREIFII